MKVALFIETDEACIHGFSTEEDKDHEWHKEHYHLMELPDQEVRQWRVAFEAFKKAQERIESLRQGIVNGEMEYVLVLDGPSYFTEKIIPPVSEDDHLFV